MPLSLHVPAPDGLPARCSRVPDAKPARHPIVRPRRHPARCPNSQSTVRNEPLSAPAPCPPQPPVRSARAALLVFLALPAVLVGCRPERPAERPADRPNILLIVWDTCRRDRMSVYGHSAPTTPFVETWARQARIYDDCVSAGSTTVPAHAALFTGLLPYQHGATNQRPHLSEQFVTLAERLQQAGYATYMFSENPLISAETRLAQGFDLVEHPWSPRFRDQAARITRDKIDPRDISTELARKIHDPAQLNEWNIKAAGPLVQRGLLDWLARRRPSQPYFAFLNYMEAHRPLIPPRRYRERFMSPAQVEQSFRVDRTWVPMWAYTFGLREYPPEDIELTARTYDAALAELDELLRDLLTALRDAGRLDNTAVILTSDHGEHLGEHHMFDHQFSVYNELLYVPLVVHYPPRFTPGRDPRPVTNVDLFPTLLELAGLVAPPEVNATAVSLLHPRDRRPRIGEYPAPELEALRRVALEYPGFDPRPWQRCLRAYYAGPYKLIWSSDQRHELYDVQADPREARNLLPGAPEVADELLRELDDFLRALTSPVAAADPAGRAPPAAGNATPEDALTDEMLRRLQALGYAGGDYAPEETSRPASSAPASAPSRPDTP